MIGTNIALICLLVLFQVRALKILNLGLLAAWFVWLNAHVICRAAISTLLDKVVFVIFPVRMNTSIVYN